MDKGGWSRGGPKGREASLLLLTLACVHPLHTPRDSRHKCLSAPHLRRVTLSSGPKTRLQRFNPSSLSTHPPLLPSVRSSVGGKGGRGFRGRIPCSIPTNFLISFASMLCPKFTPLTYPPYSLSLSVPPPLPPLFSVVLDKRSESTTGVSCCLAAIGTFNNIWTYCHHIRRNCGSTFSLCFSQFKFVPPWGIYKLCDLLSVIFCLHKTIRFFFFLFPYN